jgi:metallo-beta-lactamase class B
MKTLIRSFLAFFIVQFANAQNLEIKHLTGNFYIYTTYQQIDGQPFPANGLYLVTDEGVVMIDSPWDQAQIQPLLDSIQKRHGKKLLLCIATHYHSDRTGGFDYLKLKGIRTYSSKQTLKLCRKHNERQAQFTFEKDTVFNIGGYKIRTFYPGRGHTKDNIVVWFENDKILYGGCFIKSTQSTGLGNLADADLHAWPKSVRQTIDAFPNPAYVIPGHQGWQSNRGLQHTLQLLGEHKKH